MKIVVACLAVALLTGCTCVQPQVGAPQPTIQINLEKNTGLSVTANQVQFEDLVRTIFHTMAQQETSKGETTFSMPPELAARTVSLRLQDEMSRRKIFAALEEAGNCKMHVSEDGNHATFTMK